MKFALVGPFPPYRGGISQYMENLSLELGGKGHETVLFSYRRQFPKFLYPGESDLSPGKTSLGPICSYSLDCLQPLTWWATASKIKAGSPQAVIFPWWITFFAPMFGCMSRWLASSNINSFFICHNVLPHEQRIVDRLLTRWALQLGKGFIVQSRKEKELLQDLLPGRNVKIIPHPVYDMFREKRLLKSSARQQLQIPQDVPMLLFFGFVRPYKGLRYLLEAFSLVRPQIPAAQLWIVGEFWHDKQEYLGLAERLGLLPHLRIIDRYVPDSVVPLYFSAADVLMAPYVRISQSGVVQMAFGMGLPVIATRVGGLPEAIDDGLTGLLVPAENPKALSDAIQGYFLENRQEPMRAEIARREWHSGWDRLVAALISLRQEAEP